MNFSIICNRVEGPMATCDDLHHAGQIVHALMISRGSQADWLDYWVRDDAGAEYLHDAWNGTVFAASSFDAPQTARAGEVA